MTDLVTFLMARFHEDEQVARAAKDAPCIECGHSLEDHRRGRPYLYCVARGCDCPSYEHVVVHDPARALADVAAKRAIVARYPRLATGWLEQGQTDLEVAEDEVATILRLLAMPYAAHPDYSPSWAIDTVPGFLPGEAGHGMQLRIGAPLPDEKLPD